ncbi:MAG: class I SAM-dependent methyltransferase, partial [Planctomycetes bacterium]|nr:class I SAM-dependent methyltransferase [Planctomycetota bacterium]
SLQTELIAQIDNHVGLVLTVTDTRLELRTSGKRAPGPVFVDFVGGSLGHSRTVNRFGMLFKAIGLKKESQPPSVIDATAGLCHDAFLMACEGCHVTAIERSPILHALIVDGVHRAIDVDNDLALIFQERLQVMHADAGDVLAKLSPQQQPDVVYLDPMFPPRTKSALVKKEMRVLRSVVGDDEDSAALLTTARHSAKRRVVVKRMKHAPQLAADPMACFQGKTTRFDVYAPFAKSTQRL